MTRTIIFFSGLGVPKFISKSFFVWHHSFWKNYQKIYLHSPIPRSDRMVKNKLNEFSNLINQFTNPIVVGHSLGSWWSAHLACEPDCQMKKMVLLTPLCHAEHFPIFNISSDLNPLKRLPHHMGPHKSLILGANQDLLVPANFHAKPLVQHYNSLYYPLEGGHFYQSNHKAALSFIKDWVELD